MQFMRMFAGHSFTRRKLAAHLSMEYSTVCARVHKLLNDGLLIEPEERKFEQATNRTVKVVSLPDQQGLA